MATNEILKEAENMEMNKLLEEIKNRDYILDLDKFVIEQDIRNNWTNEMDEYFSDKPKITPIIPKKKPSLKRRIKYLLKGE